MWYMIISGIFIFWWLSLWREEVQDEYWNKNKKMKLSRKWVLGLLFLIIWWLIMAIPRTQNWNSDNEIKKSMGWGLGCSNLIETRRLLISNYENCMEEVVEKSNKEVETVLKWQNEMDSETILIFTDWWMECAKGLFLGYDNINIDYKTNTDYKTCSFQNQLLIVWMDKSVLKYQECWENVMKNTIKSETNADVIWFLTGVVDCQSDFLESVESFNWFNERINL